jgi:hypothetical protein
VEGAAWAPLVAVPAVAASVGAHAPTWEPPALALAPRPCTPSSSSSSSSSSTCAATSTSAATAARRRARTTAGGGQAIHDLAASGRRAEAESLGLRAAGVAPLRLAGVAQDVDAEGHLVRVRLRVRGQWSVGRVSGKGQG